MSPLSVNLPPDRYVLAVSGGVDSMTLMDILRRQPDIELVVAHFNHGTRPDSAADQDLVARIAGKYQLPLEVGLGQLGPRVSEDVARKARYSFLQLVQKKYQAKAIVTAHHQDDLIETALINLLRGTGRRGLVAIASNPNIIRPLLDVPKTEILAYAKKNGLHWREDTTNQDRGYLRNYLRQQLIPKLSPRDRRNLLANIETIAKTDLETQKLLEALSQSIIQEETINRQKFSQLPHEIANELVVSWLRQRNIKDFNQPLVERLNMALKTAKPGTRHNVLKGLWLIVGQKTAHFANEV